MLALKRTLVSVGLAVLLAGGVGCGSDDEDGGANEPLCVDMCAAGARCGGDLDDPDCASICTTVLQEHEAAGCGTEYEAALSCSVQALQTTCDHKTACAQEFQDASNCKNAAGT